MKEFICCICYGVFNGCGNNPDGAVWKNENGVIEEPQFRENQRCCDDCNNRFVIPGRIYKMYKGEKNNG